MGLLVIPYFLFSCPAGSGTGVYFPAGVRIIARLVSVAGPHCWGPEREISVKGDLCVRRLSCLPLALLVWV